MFLEAAQSPAVVREQLRRNESSLRELGARLRKHPPRVVVTCARGSSDHAATYAKYMIEAHTGVLASSAAPSVSSVYEAAANMQGALFIAISQSGRSPDLLTATQSAKASGALTVALCNSEDAPLMSLADAAVPLHAGAEASVAATKSFIASLSCIAHLVASWTEQRELMRALDLAPEQLARAWECDWSQAVEVLQPAVNLYAVARGFGLAAAQEAALKLKETCALHAEAFSSAEVKHGPMALVRAGFPLLMFAQADETLVGVQTLAQEFSARGARVLLAGAQAPGVTVLPTVSGHPIVAPLVTIQSFYRMVEALAIARGLDPDRPPYLSKVTETV